MKSKKILNLILVILILVALILIVIIGINYKERNQKDQELQNLAEEIIENLDTTEDDEEILYRDYEGYQVIGIIEIPTIDLKYPILIETTEETLKKSITRIGTDEVNGIGNLSLAGHNYLNGSFLGKLNKLENDDEIIITDLYGNQVTYKVFNKYVVEPDDTSVLEPVEENTREITLITCTRGNSKRLIIKAREI